MPLKQDVVNWQDTVFKTHGHTLIPFLVLGKVSVLEDTGLDTFHAELNKPMPADKEDPKLLLKAGDIYKELRLRGYDYGKTFQGILESNNAGNSPQMHLKLTLWR